MEVIEQSAGDRQFQLGLLQVQVEIRTRLRATQDVPRALIHVLRKAMALFEVEEAALAVLRSGQTSIRLEFVTPRGAAWDLDFMTTYLQTGRPKAPENVMLAAIRRRDRSWGLLALRAKEDRAFETYERRALFDIANAATDLTMDIDRDQAIHVRRKLERKIANRLEPKDLIYDILHALRSLTKYDHSASLFILHENERALRLDAEQIAWTKAKSKRVGWQVSMENGVRQRLLIPDVRLYVREGDVWVSEASSNVDPIAHVMDYRAAFGEQVPQEVAMICAPILSRDQSLGLLKISARRPEVLGRYEKDLIEEFLPLASLAVLFLLRTESLQQRVLQAERKHILANLTRGIAHDVNNALGSLLPLVQQMQEDVRDPNFEIRRFAEDLHQMEGAIQTCRRIFGSMLTLARGSSRVAGHGNLRRAVEGALSVLQDGLSRKSIEVDLDLPAELPTIRAGQGDLTQVILNLCANARDAVDRGGKIRIVARPTKSTVDVTIEDDGVGIPPDDLPRVMEPFFSTKDEGSGLGLSICRSVLSDLGTDLQIQTAVGKGTKFSFSLPVLSDA